MCRFGYTKLSEEQIAEARQMREDGEFWNNIAKKLGVTRATVQRAVDPEYAARARDRLIAAGIRRAPINPPVPPEVLSERNRAYAAPVSLTAMVMGDPLPGRSALEARR